MDTIITQLSFLSDNDIEPRVRRLSVPLVKLVDGKWCWLVFGTNEYRHEPALEQFLLAALSRRARREAA